MQKTGSSGWTQRRWEKIGDVNRKGKKEITKGAGKKETEETVEGNKDKLKRS